MEKILNAIGWRDIQAEEVSKLDFFVAGFREWCPAYYSTEEIEKEVCLIFGKFGRDTLSTIYESVVVSIEKSKYETLGETFASFNRACESQMPFFEMVGSGPRIGLFMDFVKAQYDRALLEADSLNNPFDTI